MDKKEKVPLIGLGTWELSGKSCISTVKMALELGYRHIDTALIYENHRDIAKAIHGFNREELFITSKFFLDQKSAEESCDLALEELHLDYLDLFLIHWPDREKPMIKVLKEMEKLKRQGRIHHIGVSNFTIHHLQDAIDNGIQIDYNQVEFHPYLYQKELWQFCQNHQIGLIAYRPLGKGELVQEEIFKKIGDKYQKTPAQIILKWLIQKEVAVVVKGSSKKHLQENFRVFDFFLHPEDMKNINELNRNQRFCETDYSDFNY
ncbi:MAG TPA: aldo/keto reductase [Candidatus Rhabdochlamydia sp.]|jgi:diketogulonate reductase-like aldo/keto reductase|nr:aldo/keto reductase [Candidatus Rhabdochlamydia sp.]